MHFRTWSKVFVATTALLQWTGIEAFCQDQLTTAPQKSVRIEAREGLLYDPVRFQIDPGTDLEVIVANTDSTDLPHNLVFVRPEKRVEVALQALELGVEGPARQYLPESSAIVAATRLIEHGKAERLRFVVPEETGVYSFVCTFPGHSQLMYGAMYVGVRMPSIDQDPNVPPLASVLRDGKVSSARPNIYRMFMPNSGPAAIAVALPRHYNYCWDAGTCVLRYVWEGDFLDCQKVWNSKGDAIAEVLGEVKWETGAEFPFSFEQLPNPPAPRFRGYRMKDGIPEFRYQVGEIAVSEKLVENQEGALLRQFSFDGVVAPVIFRSATAASAWIPNRGESHGQRTLLSPDEAKSFNLTFHPAGDQ